MKTANKARAGGAAVEDADDLLRTLVDGPSAVVRSVGATGVIIGTLVAMTDSAQTPLVVYPGRTNTSAVRARSTVDLHGAHIGRQVVLVFEGDDSSKPIVIGVLREGGPALEQRPGSVAVDADGERLLVTATEQLVLRCGKASITLTKAGKVLIDGVYVSSRSSGMNRVKGGSIQLN